MLDRVHRFYAKSRVVEGGRVPCPKAESERDPGRCRARRRRTPFVADERPHEDSSCARREVSGDDKVGASEQEEGRADQRQQAVLKHVDREEAFAELMNR